MNKSVLLLWPVLAALSAGPLFGQAAEAEDAEDAIASLQAVPEPPTPPVPPAPVGRHRGGVYLGVGVADIDAERGKALKLSDVHGVEVTRVDDQSPAEKAGLKEGDVVLEYNGQRVEGTDQFMRLVRETPVGRQVRLLVSRNGATQTINATIGERKGRLTFAGPDPDVFVEMGPEFQRDMAKMQQELRNMHIPDVPHPNMSWRSRMLGVEAEALNSQLAEFFGVKEGVLVRSVVKDSAADKAGIKAGDVIVKLEQTKISTPQDLTRAVQSQNTEKPVSIGLVRNRKEMTVSAKLEDRRPTSSIRSQRIRVPQQQFRFHALPRVTL